MVYRDGKSDNTEMSDLISSTKTPTASVLVFSGKSFESHNKRSGEGQSILLTCESDRQKRGRRQINSSPCLKLKAPRLCRRAQPTHRLSVH